MARNTCISARANTPEALGRRLEVYYYLKYLNDWLREQNLEFPPEEFVSEFEIQMRKNPTIYEKLQLQNLAKIPHNPKNKVISDSEEIRKLKELYRLIWIRDYPVDKDHTHSLLATVVTFFCPDCDKETPHTLEECEVGKQYVCHECKLIHD